VRQVNDFVMGCKNESAAWSVCSTIGTKLVLHNEAEPPLKCLGLVDSLDGHHALQTRDCIKLSAESCIWRLLWAHGWDDPSPCKTSNKPELPVRESDVADLFNLTEGPVENVPKHQAPEAEQGFEHRSIPGEVLLACILHCPGIGHAVTTLAKFSKRTSLKH